MFNDRVSRKAYSKNAAGIRDVPNTENTTACFHVSVSDRKSQPKARSVNAVLPKRLEHAVDIVGGQPATTVFHFYRDVFGNRVRIKGYVRTRQSKLERIL